MDAVTLDQHHRETEFRGQTIFATICRQIRGSHSFRDAESHGSLNGIIESEKSAEWRNVINDKKREWTDSPNQQEPQTQPDYDLMHINWMRETRPRLFFYTDSQGLAF